MTADRLEWRANGIAIAAAAPALAALGFSVVIAVGWVIGSHPFWARPELTLSEAAATRDSAEVVHLIEQRGQNPNASYAVREGVMGPATSISPVEAATISKRAEMVRLLLRHGATPTPEERHRLACVALEIGAGDVVDALVIGADRAERLRCVPAASQ